MGGVYEEQIRIHRERKAQGVKTIEKYDLWTTQKGSDANKIMCSNESFGQRREQENSATVGIAYFKIQIEFPTQHPLLPLRLRLELTG